MNTLIENNKLLKKNKALVLGMGATGISIAKWLAENKRTADFFDTRKKPPGLLIIKKLIPKAEIFCGEMPICILDNVVEILISPGFEMNLTILKDARRKNIPIRSDIDLFMNTCKGKVIGITGSNGKSTVTSLVSNMLNVLGIKAVAGGNLGTPALDLLHKDAEVFVLELSSFHLERSKYLELHAAALLNLSPDHLDRHTSFKNYEKAKQRIYKRCGTAVVNRNEVLPQPNQISFGTDIPDHNDWGLVELVNEEWIACGKKPVMPIKDLKLVGRHNLLNVLAAFAIASTLDLPLEGLIKAARDFSGLPHRMNLVPSEDGILWINDSKATNAAAALASIVSTEGKLILIAGGDAKGADLGILSQELSKRNVTIIAIGKDRQMFVDGFTRFCKVKIADDLEQAVNMASNIANSGDTVLLAPACSSLDMFSSYAERGQRFSHAIHRLQT
ncbi:MAG: UDP-N-acetylmuramoyl-L-alanine--D-glutamate ligase [Pseudomonadota bacterium]|nr:UDP-N-acetylmuramoyl-L-alanine--D-glutamate ligase [Pseudomonadota bacterium]